MSLPTMRLSSLSLRSRMALTYRSGVYLSCIQPLCHSILRLLLHLFRQIKHFVRFHRSTIPKPEEAKDSLATVLKFVTLVAQIFFDGKIMIVAPSDT